MHKVRITFRNGKVLKFRAENVVLKWDKENANLTNIEWSGGNKRCPRWVDIREILLVQWS